MGGVFVGGRIGFYLVLGCVGYFLNRGDYGEGVGRLVGVLLLRDRVIGEWFIIVEGDRGGFLEVVVMGWDGGKFYYFIIFFGF